IAPRIEAIGWTRGPRKLPLRLDGQTASIVDAERERFVPAHAVHRFVFVRAWRVRPGGARAVAAQHASVEAPARAAGVPAAFPTTALTMRIRSGVGGRRTGVLLHEAPKPPHGDFVEIETNLGDKRLELGLLGRLHDGEVVPAVAPAHRKREASG